MSLNKNKLDTSQIFLTYVAVVGDCNRVAAALDIDPLVIEELATKECWPEKIKRITLLSRGDKPGDFERAQNRALNFVMAHRIRLVIDKVLSHFHDLTAEEVINKLSTVREAHVTLSSRFLSDLAAATEKVQWMSYTALGDSISEREGRASDSEEVNATALHAAVLAALNNPSATFKESDLLVAEASETVKQIAAQSVPPTL